MFDERLSDIMDEDIEFLPLLSKEDEKEMYEESFPEDLPLLPLRNNVLYPGVVIPITVGRDKSIKLVKEAHDKDKIVGVIAQKDSKTEDPGEDDIYKTGTVARIVRMLRMPDGNTTIIIQGRRRFQLKQLLQKEPYLWGKTELLDEPSIEEDREFTAIVSMIKDLASEIIDLSPNIPSEASTALDNITSHTFLVNFIASNLDAKVAEKQEILEINDFKTKAEYILKKLREEHQMVQIKQEIQSKVHSDIEEQQREYLLNQQLKRIKEELGDKSDDSETQRLKEAAKEKKWGDKVQQTFEKELNKLNRLNPAMPEYSVTLNYLDCLIDLPWNEFTEDRFDLERAKKILDKDHFDLKKVKKRILEYLAVLKLKNDMKAPILCFVGPPGVGKTSLGRSIARALKRKFIRMSLGGLRDEAEIRGHRKTYIGAMPGRIIQSIRKVNSSNPVMILDEIDKVGNNFRGDPASALLEVLDPEQNSHFYDNFLELEYDLSKVMFIATANRLDTIHPALRDRMEVIEISGYTVEEKTEIAKQHIIPRLREEHGLKGKNLQLRSRVIKTVIQEYTRESGVRNLEKKLAAVMRNVARKVAEGKNFKKVLSNKDIRRILGPRKFEREIYKEVDMPGVAVGLAWTQTGGDILFIESSLHRGKGKLKLTGSLGDVMKESANTALSFIKAQSEALNINPKIFNHWDIHLHVPEGAIPKDGPSAGIPMLTSLASIFTQRKAKPYMAMTGEITLRGKVLPVGGIKEKILAAKRSGIKEIVLCKKNKKDLEEINDAHLEDLKFHFVSDMMEVLELGLEKHPVKSSKDLEMPIWERNDEYPPLKAQ